ncbi:uncharacterized protein NPIL_495291 [Nephila pilipes]|uniref:Uncharacterized protein n=1 Tax=Nephila pilipes TaxID=299642 RepID=A0A8X6P5J4_NEPPI|nr:uncharacterized protein NPIL_495291 [Nephila pilipes]
MIPTPDITVETTSRALMHGWISRSDKVNPLLAPPYTLAHLVIIRTDKNFVIDFNGKENTVFIYRVKLAYHLTDDINANNNSEFQPSIEQFTNYSIKFCKTDHH